jgi:CheY-like chemotaxis protein/anti-sigma regulatory factor (Ser/Thr protein kinase)
MPTGLVVDDSAVDRRLVGGMLTKNPGIDVEFAVDGKEALRKVQTSPPALVITDLVMPEMDGLELVSAIVDQYPQIPVILMTGKGSEDIAVKALKAGAASYVPKTALHHLLLETVTDVLAMAKDILRRQRLIEFLKTGRFVFVLANDADMIPTLISYVQNIVISIGLCDEADVIRVCIALEEALRNAMFHGNLEITSEQREGDAAAYAALLAQRTSQDPWQKRRLRVEVSVSKERGTFVVRDQGPGFDPTKLPDPTDPANLEKVSGRGLLLMRTFMDEVRFNKTGNEVTMVKTKPAPVEGVTV